MEVKNINEQADKLYSQYKEYMDFYESKATVGKTRSITTEDIYAFGKQLENYSQWQSFVESNGGQGDLGVLPNVALDVITAANTSSVIPMFASVQPLDDVQGTIWFKNIVAKTNRGNVKDEQNLVTGMGGRQTVASQFAGSTITGEVEATGDGKTTKFAYTVKYSPVLQRTITISIAGTSVKGIDDGEGNIVGVGITKGTINYSTGAVTVEFNDAPADGAEITQAYSTDFEGMDEIPTVNTEYTSKMIKAKDFALRSEIGLFKSFAMSKRFGINPEEMIAKDLVQELNAETSNNAVLTAYINAVGTVEWNKKAPTGVSYTEHKLTFFDALASAEAQILGNAGRMNGASVIIAGTTASSTLRTMPGFVAEEQQNAVLGTHYFGTLDGKVVIRSMALPADEMVIISKGSSFFDSPVVFSPYLPLYVTNMMDGMDHNPLKSQKAVAMQAGIDAPVGTLMTKLKIVEA